MKLCELEESSSRLLDEVLDTDDDDEVEPVVLLRDELDADEDDELEFEDDESSASWRPTTIIE